MTQVKNLVRGGRVIHREFGGMFRMWLAGRRPSVLLAYCWLRHDEGMLMDLQRGLSKQPTCRILPKHVLTPQTWLIHQEVA